MNDSNVEILEFRNTQSVMKNKTGQNKLNSSAMRNSRLDRDRSRSREPSSGRSHSNSRSDRSRSDLSALDAEMHLSEKLQKYINRIAATCMTSIYAQRYIREWRRRNKADARRKMIMNADAAAQAEALAASGYSSTLQKVRYSD